MRYLKILILSVIMAILAAGTCYADNGRSIPFPFKVDFDTEKVARVCYAGHNGTSISYRDGYAVTPETLFVVNMAQADEIFDSSTTDAWISINALYENDDCTGYRRETLKRYNMQKVRIGESLPLLSANNIENLNERRLLYSDSLKGLELVFEMNSPMIRDRRFYLYVCTEEELMDYYLYSQVRFVEEED